ncbi:MAG: adenylate/guanylate cyclase domain-containing protein [Isosphaeraceae bacterium]
MAHDTTMNGPWRIQVYDQKRLAYTGEVEGPVELGRQGDGDEAVFHLRKGPERARLVIAARDEDSVSRRHALLEPTDLGARVTNLSTKVPIRLRDGPEVRPGESLETPLPMAMMLGRKLVRVQGAVLVESDVEYLREATLPPGAWMATALELPPSGLSDAPGAPFDGGLGTREVESLVRWLQAAGDAFQAASEPCEFYQGATQALVENIVLDSCRALVLEQGAWTVAAASPTVSKPKDDHWRPSQHILGRLLTERRTVWSSPQQQSADLSMSLIGLSAVVAAPILNHQGEMIGALYGERRQHGGLQGPQVRTTRVDAMLVELLACAVASGLNRLAQERAAVAAHVQFEQFFTPELARLLAERPEMLKGQDAEITVLFCDIRGFSRISHHIDTAKVVDWIGDVMTTLSDCVRAHQGVLVDYIGDELMAMWGAPEDQPEHAKLACLAALDMLDQLPAINARWESTLGEPMDLGIGLNTGMARVGNTGSRHKFKYGPLGNTVNVASRVQGVTKYLKTRLLVTKATVDQLGADIPSRRLGLVRMVNIDDPVELSELSTPGHPSWETLRIGYEAALADFEAREFRQATRILGNLVLDHPDDGPSLVLLSRVVNCLIDPDAFDPVYVTPGK